VERKKKTKNKIEPMNEADKKHVFWNSKTCGRWAIYLSFLIAKTINKFG